MKHFRRVNFNSTLQSNQVSFILIVIDIIPSSSSSNNA